MMIDALSERMREREIVGEREKLSEKDRERERERKKKMKT